MERNSYKDIIEIIKDAISADYGETKIFDRHILNTLNVSQSSLSKAKKSNRPHYKEILDWCIHTGTDPIKVFYKTKRKK